MAKRRKSKNSMRKRSNGRHQLRRARTRARLKNRSKKQIRNNPNYDKGQETWELICTVFLSILAILYVYCYYISL